MRFFLVATLLLIAAACSGNEPNYVQRNNAPCPGTGSFVYPCT